MPRAGSLSLFFINMLCSKKKHSCVARVIGGRDRDLAGKDTAFFAYEEVQRGNDIFPKRDLEYLLHPTKKEKSKAASSK